MSSPSSSSENNNSQHLAQDFPVITDNSPLGYASQSFNVDLAQRLKSSDLAILVQFFINCIRIHKELKRNFREGRTWNFCTRAELSAHFPWLSDRQCQRLMDKLVKSKIMIKGNFNKLKTDNTVWYAFQDESQWKFEKNPSKQHSEHRPISAEVDRNRPTNTTVLPTVLPFLNKDNVLREGGNVDNLKPKKTMETMSSFKGKPKTLDASRRWKLTEDQQNAFNFLDGDHINTDDGTKAFWAKTYSLERLIEVYEEAKAFKPKSMGAYMTKLLKSDAVVAKGHATTNKDFAEYFKDKTGWQQLEIMKKYVKIPCGNGNIELSYNMQPEDFQSTLTNKHANRG